MRHIQLFGMKIYFKDLGITYVKYILANISQKIYTKYILIIQLFAKIYFIYFDIYVTYIFFHVGTKGFLLNFFQLQLQFFNTFQFKLKITQFHLTSNGNDTFMYYSLIRFHSNIFKPLDIEKKQQINRKNKKKSSF